MTTEFPESDESANSDAKALEDELDRWDGLMSAGGQWLEVSVLEPLENIVEQIESELDNLQVLGLNDDQAFEIVRESSNALQKVIGERGESLRAEVVTSRRSARVFNVGNRHSNIVDSANTQSGERATRGCRIPGRNLP